MLSRPNMRFLLLGRRRYLFEDKFNAGLTKWTVTDTESNISVSNGSLVFSGGLASPGLTDPALVGKLSFVRRPGLTLEFEYNPTDGSTGGPQWGFKSDNAGGVGNRSAFFAYSGTSISAIFPPFAITPTLRTVALGVARRGMIVCEAAGAKFYTSTDGGITWYLGWYDATATTTQSPLWLHFIGYDIVSTFSYVRVYQGYAKPAVYAGTPTAPTPTLGGELATGNLVVGNWYSITATQANYFFTGCAIGNTFRATATTALDANNKVKLITLSTCLTLAADPGTRYGVVDSAPTLTAGTQCGHWIWVDDPDNPLYGVAVYHDGTSGYLEKDVNGTYTQLVKATATYSAAAQCRSVAVLDGATPKVGLFYNGAGVGTVQSITDSGFGTKVCAFSTLATNTPGAMEIHTGVGV